MAWWVVAGHAIKMAGPPDWLPRQAAALLLRADVAVNVFIIVSGFVITHLLVKQREPYGGYIWRRFLRIAPVYFFCLALAIATTSWYVEVFIDLPWENQAQIRMERLALTNQHFWAHLFAHLTLLHGLVPANVLEYSVSSFLAPAWSLSLEWQFYLVAPTLVWLMTRRLQIALLTAAGILALSIAARLGVDHLYQYPAMLLLSIQFFMVGIVSRLLLPLLPSLKVRPEILLLALLAAVAYAHSLALAIWAVFLVFVLCESGLLAAGSRLFAAVQYAAGTNPLIRNLGKFSYSTYLVHIPVFAIVAHYYGAWRGLDTREETRAAIGIAIVVVLAISPLMYRCIEKPFMELGKVRRKPLQAPAAESA